jgi:MFS family permease
LPEASGNLLGWVIDRIKINRSLIISFVGILIVLVCSIFFDSFLWRLSALILVGIFVEAIALSRRQLIADFNIKNDYLIIKTHYGFGGISAVLDEITSLGGFIGIILIGIIIDSVNWSTALILMSLILIFVFGFFVKNNIINKKDLTV